MGGAGQRVLPGRSSAGHARSHRLRSDRIYDGASLHHENRVSPLLSCPLANDNEGRPEQGMGVVGFVGRLHQRQHGAAQRLGAADRHSTGRVSSYFGDATDPVALGG